MKTNMKISKRLTFTACAMLIGALSLASINQVSCQFLQPQSHLGRLVQSITSPLVGYPSSDQSGDSYDSDSALSGAAGGQYSAENNNQNQNPDSDQQHNHYQSYERQQPQRSHRQQQQQQQQQALQQAPSQQRGVPQHYYGANAANQDEDAGAPSNPRQQQAQEYQMGAYLGPTIDDKEINGAFNSNNNDDDDGYDEGRRQRAASGSNGFASDTASASMGGSGPFYGPSEGAGAGYGSSAGSARQHEGSYRSGAASAYGPLSDEDESGADEDESPRGPSRGTRGRQAAYRSAGLNQAASQQHNQQRHRQSQPMLAAANGYAPYGYSGGPIDLNGIMAAAQGDPSAGYQVYQGDGGYPGQSGGYYNQAGPQRQAAGSMNNPYGYGANQPAGRQSSQQNDNNDDQDMDGDDE